MFIKDKFGNPVNMNQVLGLWVQPNPDEGGYEVQATNSVLTEIAQFLTTPGVSETQAEAEATLARIAGMVGVADLAQ